VIRFVLLDRVGHAFVQRGVDRADLEAILA